MGQLNLLISSDYRQNKTRGASFGLLCGLFGATSAAAFSFVALAEDNSNQLYTWGANAFGQLGHGDALDRLIPQPVLHLKGKKVKQVVLGGDISFVLLENGELYTFGKGQDGALGHNSASNESVPRIVEALKGQDVVKIDVSLHHGAAITSSGELYTWGRFWNGQLGRSTLDKGAVPSLVSELKGQKIIDVACGKNHTLALTEDGKVYAFGAGQDYAVGFGDKLDVKYPLLISTFEKFPVKIKKISAGSGFSLFLADDGLVYSCGRDDFGKLGHGMRSLYQKTPNIIRALENIKIVDIAAGEFHASALSADGKLYTWGYGKDGQTGHGDTMNTAIPTIVESISGKNIVEIRCGGGHTAARCDDGEFFVWGRGSNGQIGRGDQLESVAAYRMEPVPIQFFKNHDLQVESLSLGENHSAAIASHKAATRRK